jgi:polyisoprenyl-teichoic acid--peptidoglycan teichoic acid transferase
MFRSSQRRVSAVSLVTLLALAVISSGVTATSSIAASKAKKATPAKKSSSKAGNSSKAGASTKGMRPPNGQPINPATVFNADPASSDPAMPSAATPEEAFDIVAKGAQYYAIAFIGTDARPNEKMDRTRADTIQIFTYNKTKRRATLFAIPRDTLAAIPGKSRPDKINSALSNGSPQILLQSIQLLTGINVTHYVLTGFLGFETMVDQLTGISVLVDPAINDVSSGAQFQKGWFHFNGPAALAYGRARKTLPKGDFSRAFNQYRLILYTLLQMRTQTSAVKDLVTWINILKANSVSNLETKDYLYLAQIARSIDPITQIDFQVTPTKTKKGTTFEEVGTEGKNFFKDIAADGVRG